MPFLTRKDKKPLGIYVHVPFCRSKCMYCDFYSVTEKDSKLLEKQKEGKKRMRTFGTVSVPSEAFMAVLKLDED